MITFDRVKSNLSDVTSEQIGKAHKIFGPGNEEFYLVENSKGEYDDNGDMIEYKVQYSKEFGFTCTCPSGQHGFASVGHPSGCCWHVRAAVACFLEEEAALAEMREKIETQAKGMSKTEKAMPAWIMRARPSKGMDKAPREI